MWGASEETFNAKTPPNGNKLSTPKEQKGETGLILLVSGMCMRFNKESELPFRFQMFKRKSSSTVIWKLDQV